MMSYDGAYCSERFGPNYNAGSTAEEMAEFYGDPSNGDYDPDHVAEVEAEIGMRAVLNEIGKLQQERERNEEYIATLEQTIRDIREANRREAI